MDWLDNQGLSGFVEYPDEQEANLGKYLSQVSSHCRSLPDFSEGMTLVVLGGLGRGFALDFEDQPEQWCLSAIQIPDLLMLADEVDRPVTRYLKCIKQKKWAERKGVYFQNMSGDYNLYCCWREQNYQLVPQELSLAPGSVSVIASNWFLTGRKEVRNLVDRHVLQTIAGVLCTGHAVRQRRIFQVHDGPPDLCESGSSECSPAGRSGGNPTWP